MNASQGQKGQRQNKATNMSRRVVYLLMPLSELLLTDAYATSNTSQTPGSEAEEAVQALERFVDSTPRTNGYPSTILESKVSFVAPDYPNMYWSSSDNAERQGEKIALIQSIVDALPELDVIRLLHEVFVTRCQGPLGNIVHTPTFLKQAEKFCGCLGLTPKEAKVIALSNTISMDILACQLLAVRMLCRAPNLCSRSLL